MVERSHFSISREFMTPGSCYTNGRELLLYSSLVKPSLAMHEITLNFPSLAYRLGHWLIICPSGMCLSWLASHSFLFSFLYVVALKHVFKSLVTSLIQSSSLPLECDLVLTSCQCSGQQHGWGPSSQSASTTRQSCEWENLQYDSSPSHGLTTTTWETLSENHSTKHSSIQDNNMQLLLLHANKCRVACLWHSYR